MALLRRELLDVDQVARLIDDLELDQYADVDELVEALDSHFREMAEHHGLEQAIYSLLKRKLDKIAGYVKGEFP